MNVAGTLVASTAAAAHPVYAALAGMDPSARATLLARLPRRMYGPDEIVLREGDSNAHVFLVMSGRLTVARHVFSGQFLLTYLGPGQVFGEYSALSGGGASATVKTIENVTLLMLDLADLPEDEHGTVNLRLGRLVVSRLVRTNVRLQKKQAESLATMRAQLQSAVFSSKMVFCLSLYVATVGMSVPLAAYWPEEPLISLFFIVGFFGVAWTFVTRVNTDHAGFGMKLRDCRRGTWRGLLYTLPLLAIVLLAKWLFVRTLPGNPPLFEPLSVLEKTPFAGWGIWFIYLSAYSALSYAQEVVRCAIQGSLAMYYRAGGLPDGWRSPTVASLLFAGTHVHLSIVFALLSFAAGLYWGWIYQREKSYWAVAASHAAVGVWAMFVVGVPY